MSLDTLAKVDLHCCLDGAIDPSLLGQWQMRAGGAATTGPALSAAMALTKPEQVADRRAWLQPLLQSADDLIDASADLARRLIAEVVVHVELVIDCDTLRCNGLPPCEVLRAVDAGCELAVTERDDVFLSWTLLVEVSATATSSEALALVQQVIADRPDRVAGFYFADDAKAASLDRIAAAVAAIKAADLRVVIAAGDRKDPDRVLAALNLGAHRLVGGTAGLGREDVMLQLRARRVPVVSLPSLQMMAGMARSWNSHPIKRMKDGSVMAVVGSGWPTWTQSSLTGELEQVSRQLHWHLDDLRNLTTRAIEAGFMPPTLRFQLARTVEIWRHRPMVQALAKTGGDPFAM